MSPLQSKTMTVSCDGDLFHTFKTIYWLSFFVLDAQVALLNESISHRTSEGDVVTLCFELLTPSTSLLRRQVTTKIELTSFFTMTENNSMSGLSYA